MRITQLIFLLMPFVATFAQENTYDVSKTTIQVGTKDALYLKAKSWVVNNFNSANDVIQLDDKIAGRLIVKAFMDAKDTSPNKPASICEDGSVYFTMTIDVKTNKSRIAFTDLRHEGMNLGCGIGGQPDFDYGLLNKSRPNEASYESIKKNAQSDCLNLIASIEKALKVKPKQDNW
jgi:hypothetical protein